MLIVMSISVYNRIFVNIIKDFYHEMILNYYFCAHMSTNKVNFRSKIGLIAATVGSAVGLGNLWRFPGEVANGG